MRIDNYPINNIQLLHWVNSLLILKNVSIKNLLEDGILKCQ